MDLYEALKSGTSEDDLIKTFTKDLAEARMKLAAEKKKQQEQRAAAKKIKEQNINKTRDQLINGLVEYCKALFDGNEKELKASYPNLEADLEQELKKIEEETEKITDAFSFWTDFFFPNVGSSEISSSQEKKKENNNKNNDDDDDIIRQFLNSLR